MSDGPGKYDSQDKIVAQKWHDNFKGWFDTIQKTFLDVRKQRQQAQAKHVQNYNTIEASLFNGSLDKLGDLKGEILDPFAKLMSQRGINDATVERNFVTGTQRQMWSWYLATAQRHRELLQLAQQIQRL